MIRVGFGHGHVHRRIGGLENVKGDYDAQIHVHRRIGGLENDVAEFLSLKPVHRRIGGLEILADGWW